MDSVLDQRHVLKMNSRIAFDNEKYLEEQTRAILSTVPLKRMGKPGDVANLVSFLASEEASFITGQSIFICGGITVGLVHF